ncbi:MAG: hypothetical protein SPD80_03915 [Atopobium sp.]|uniref:hypothetical protein n=1 Tax=Atopobium sp. TaxID=1872650 RepID=UPI002A835813|nr:hypothetical protein [Atopobium sp.]MDY4522718.1 hypothetical protein [Atopobium sp.]
MKKIIKNKLYNTETARKIADYEPSGFGKTDFHWYQETLYQKRTGEYFIHGEGGPLSPYSKPCGNRGAQESESIAPLDYEQARAWAEEHIDADEYIKEFGDVAEDGEGTVATYLKLSAQARAELDKRCAQSGKTRAEIINELLLG